MQGTKVVQVQHGQIRQGQKGGRLSTSSILSVCAVRVRVLSGGGQTQPKRWALHSIFMLGHWSAFHDLHQIS